MSLIKHVPNGLTSLNLLSGMIGIYAVLEHELVYGCYFILLAALFDFLDGFAARILKVQSEIGKQLDSLADLVTFGVLPSFIVFEMLRESTDLFFLPFFAFIIGVQSAMRLAKFNIDERQEEQFIGLPTPANALFFSALPFLMSNQAWAKSILENPYFILALTFLFAYLLTAEVPMLALKFKNYKWAKNKWRYLTLLISLISLLLFGFAGIPIAIVSYICLSLINQFLGGNEIKT